MTILDRPVSPQEATFQRSPAHELALDVAKHIDTAHQNGLDNRDIIIGVLATEEVLRAARNDIDDLAQHARRSTVAPSMDLKMVKMREGKVVLLTAPEK